MDDGTLLVAAPLVALIGEVGNYGFKEWLAVLGSLFGMGGSVFGIWRAWRYSKAQIAQRLMEYLEDEEAKIKQARDRVVRHLRRGEALGNKIDHRFFTGMADALADSSEAEKKLLTFANAIKRDMELGQKYLDNSRLCMSTLQLARGAIAKAKSEPAAARSALASALECYPEDAEAERYLGELALASGDPETAQEHFGRAYALAPDDKLLKAETWEALGSHYQQQGRRRLELGALVECAPVFAETDIYPKAAVTFARAGEVASQLGRTRQAPELLKSAFENYQSAGDEAGMKAMRKHLEDLGEDVSRLPLFEEAHRRPLPWFWIRLALELVLISIAVYLFFVTLR